MSIDCGACNDTFICALYTSVEEWKEIEKEVTYLYAVVVFAIFVFAIVIFVVVIYCKLKKKKIYLSKVLCENTLA